MGQIKEQKDVIVVGAGHSLMLGHMPSKVPVDAYASLNFGNMDTENLGFFSSPDYNTFYPGVSQEDFTPKDADFIEPVYRLLSEVIVNKESNPVDFSINGVLRASTKLLIGQTINCDHSTDIANAIGSVKHTYWQESYKSGGLVIPAGINGVLKIDAKANPRIARGILMDPPSVHSNSVSVRFSWDKSHPKLEGYDFWEKVGTYDEKGELIRRIVTEVECYYETSLVSHGADPFAQKVDDQGNLNNPKFASRQSYSYRTGEVEYYFMDLKTLSKAKVLNNNTMVFNNDSNNPKTNNSGNMTKEEILALMVGAGLLQLAEGKEVNEENVKEAIQALIAAKTTAESNVATLKQEKETLDAKVIQLQGEINTLTQKVDENKAMVTLGTDYLTNLRSETVANFKKLHGEKADENIITLIGTADAKQLLALGKSYTEDLEKKFPMSCKDCGSHNVNRGSASSEGEGGEGTDDTKSANFADITNSLVNKANRGSMFSKK